MFRSSSAIVRGSVVLALLAGAAAQVPVHTEIEAPETTLSAGAELNLLCEADGYPDPDVSWTKDGAPLHSGERIQVMSELLTVSSVAVSDSGVYGCHASNGRSQHSSTVQVTVQGLYIPPQCADDPFFANCELIVRSDNCTRKYFVFCCKSCMEAGYQNPHTETPPTDPVHDSPVRAAIRAEHTTLSAGAELNLSCEVDGYHEPDVHWTKDGVPLHSDDRIQATNELLTVSGMAMSDSGVYGCHASNGHSQHSSTVQVTVQETPEVGCVTSEFGCCYDNETGASGPGGQGCPCYATEFGCCKDNETGASGPDGQRCPCQATEFGCCYDNETGAPGPGGQGCPCHATEFGCCYDNETGAPGPGGQGCPCHATEFGCCYDNETGAPGPGGQGCPCHATEFGCCYDNETGAPGPGGQGCPCQATEFGCCYDSETGAPGPGCQGCPCQATEFGCCYDNETGAPGPGGQGCPCHATEFGCCYDNETGAPGPGGQGCPCHATEFGCCYDNNTEASGPGGQGCHCHATKFGCCYDRGTRASGPSGLGCPCHATEFGCCYDRETRASGPGGQGCPCHATQFGCCPDGVTPAGNAELEGCVKLCDASAYGCCGDGQTAAIGPDRYGCNCASSKYGCCPDGQTEAKDMKFSGCPNVPVNRQAACSLPPAPGSCLFYTPQWYFNTHYGGCDRFLYGGCEGNSNRFATKFECEDVCVRPSDKDACHLPKSIGSCDGAYLRWYYDSDYQQCGQFQYTGCLGNANNFETLEKCQRQCQPDRNEGLYVPPQCEDNEFFANCAMIVRSKFCNNKYYSRFCCKSCVQAGLLDPNSLTPPAA